MSKSKNPVEIAKEPGTIFEAATLQFHDKSYPVPANRMMGLIAAIEEVVTFHELISQAAAQRVRLTTLAQAFGAALRFAGATATDEEVYAGMFNGGLAAERVADAVSSLLALMVPPDNIRKAVHAAMGVGVRVGNAPAPVTPQ